MEYSDSSDQVEQADTSPQIVVARGVLTVQPKEISLSEKLAQPSRKFLLLSLLCTGAIATMTVGVIRWRYAQSYEETDKAYVTTDTYAVNSRISGEVVSVIATENQVVKKGSVLVKLNPSQYQAKVKEAQITLEQAQQQVKKATTNLGAVKAKIKNQPKLKIPNFQDTAIVSARSTVKTAIAELKRIQPAFVKAELDYECFVKLQQSGFIPFKTLAQAKVKYDNLLKTNNLSTQSIKFAFNKLTTAQQNYLDAQIKLAQQKIEDNHKKILSSQASLQQKMELSSKKILEKQSKLQQKIEENRQKILSSQASLPQQPLKIKKSTTDQQKALQQLETQKASQQKALQKKADKQKAEYQKALQQLDKQFTKLQEKQNQVIARLTEQKTLVVQQESANLLLLDYTRSQIYLKTAQTAVKQAQAQLKNAEYQLYYTKITAPNAGKINIKRTQAGESVQPGQTLMSLVPQKLWVAANFEKEQLKKIKPGQSVQIQFKALTDKSFTGKVQSILPINNTNYNHLRPPVKISFDLKTLGNYKSRITPGTPAFVKVQI